MHLTDTITAGSPGIRLPRNATWETHKHPCVGNIRECRHFTWYIRPDWIVYNRHGRPDTVVLFCLSYVISKQHYRYLQLELLSGVNSDTKSYCADMMSSRNDGFYVLCMSSISLSSYSTILWASFSHLSHPCE